MTPIGGGVCVIVWKRLEGQDSERCGEHWDWFTQHTCRRRHRPCSHTNIVSLDRHNNNNNKQPILLPEVRRSNPVKPVERRMETHALMVRTLFSPKDMESTPSSQPAARLPSQSCSISHDVMIVGIGLFLFHTDRSLTFDDPANANGCLKRTAAFGGIESARHTHNG
jgi:hypothetical protein